MQATSNRARKTAISFTDYKHLAFPQYQHAPHLELLDQALSQVSLYVETGGQEGIGRLEVSMPPRHGKTLTTSELFPTWHLGRLPENRIMLVGYGQTLPEKSSRRARNLIQSAPYQNIYNIELAKDSKSAAAWDIEDHRGGLDALGIMGGATGKGAHILIIDDAIKSRLEAESVVYRDRVYEAYLNDLYTRLEPGGAVVLMMTRWHEDDLIGRLRKHDNETWVRLCLPAIAEDSDDILGRAEGAALWPERFPIERLQEIRATLGSYAFNALYQQRPQPREGGLFKWQTIESHRVASAPNFMRVVVAIDPSGSKHGDEVGIIVAGMTRDRHSYVVADNSLHASPDQWARKSVLEYHNWKADVLVGERNYGGDMIRALIETVDKTVNYQDVVATRGKELRAEPIAALYEQGIVHHVGEFAKLEDEMTTWQHGAPSPNRMDALVWALTELHFGNYISPFRVRATLKDNTRKW